MNKIKILLVLIVFIAIGLVSGFVYRHFFVSTEPKVHYVELLKDKVSPDVVTVKIGEIIEFDSKDGGTHDLAQGSGADYGLKHDHQPGGLESGNFGPKEGYRVSFKKVGTYEFHDHNNPKLFVTVIVYKDA